MPAMNGCIHGCLAQSLPLRFIVILVQAVSSRPDVVPPAYLSELEKLQDRIPPFSDDDARALIESELGQPISAVFSELTPTTVAAASLGQVSAMFQLSNRS